MDISGPGKPINTALSFRYNANNEELEELFNVCDDDPPTPQCDASPSNQGECASPKKVDKTSSIIDKYFKRADKPEKVEDTKSETVKVGDDSRSSSVPKEVTSSPVKDYLNRLGKRSIPAESGGEIKESPNETWKIFHDFKYKIAQAVEDMKSRSAEETREKSVARENSISDSEENSVIKDCDQHSVGGDTDNQVSSLDSSLQNLSEFTQAVTAKANECELSLPLDKNNSECSDDTHRNTGQNELSDASRDFLDDSLMEVESGIEALEESHIDVTNDILPTDLLDAAQPQDAMPPPPYLHPITANFSCPPNKNLPELEKRPTKAKTYFFNFFMALLTLILVVSYVLMPNSDVWNGFVLGLWVFYFLSELKHWVLDTYFCDWESDKLSFFQVKKNAEFFNPIYTIPSVKEHKPLKKYEGWINHYRMSDYDPYTYHINKTITAFMKLEGCNLRISYTRVKVAKRELWDEKLDKVDFYQHRLYNLNGARVILLPKGLVRRRQWSKKYPICIVLNEQEKIQVLEKETLPPEKKQSGTQTERKSQVEVDNIETNTSPEKKKKFVWRRRDKSISQTETEPGKEGLRHRIVRKMHRDKKPDNAPNASACTDASEGQTEKVIHFDDTSIQDSLLELSAKSTSNIKEDAEEELDEAELSRIKDFLEEAELDGAVDGAAEGEWSVHVKQSRDQHSHLFLFARTGRDKHEWYRRFNTAILESNAGSTEGSASEDKSGNDGDIEMAVFKVSEKDTVAFAKPNAKTVDSMSETVTITSLTQSVNPGNFESYEKLFWPYLFKIIQTHEITIKRTTEIGIMCQMDPLPERNKKKKKKSDSKAPLNVCTCRTLPGEVTWINTLLARLMFDVMRDPVIIQRLQNRIQRKLNTLKLPAFMSPLLVTELRLNGACPLVARVAGPAWDARGVWLDADLRYDGGAYITILTQINLMKLKEKSMDEQLEEVSETIVDQEVKAAIARGLFAEKPKKKKPAVYDSDVEDSAESSTDDENPLPIDSNDDILAESVSTTSEGGSSKKKFLRMVDRIATNKYFQQVTDYKYVKRAMEGLSNTDIKLQLEVRGLEGRLAFNLPPPPHDRIWVGFRDNPQLVLKAKPAVGARTLRFAQISNWIEQKLTREFEKVLVLPNMEDIVIDLMTPTPVSFE